MLPSRWLPRADLLTPWEEMDRWLDGFLGRTGQEETDAVRRALVPRADVVETEDGFTIEIELPGLSSKDVKIEVTNGVLSISGEKKAEKREKTTGFHQLERSYGAFCRSFRLPGSVDEAKVSASFENGVLRVSLPKEEVARPRLIEVKEG